MARRNKQAVCGETTARPKSMNEGGAAKVWDSWRSSVRRVVASGAGRKDGCRVVGVRAAKWDGV